MTNKGKRMRKHTWLTFRAALAGAALAALVGACGQDGAGDDTGGGDDDVPGQADAGPTNQWDELLGARKTDYGMALRIAALRLTGDLPTLADIKYVTDAPDQKAAYASQIEAYLEDPRFARQIRDFWRDSFRIGGGVMDSAPNFAAQLVVEERSYMELFTATGNTCPTFDTASGAFTAAACAQTGGTVGVLTDPNVMKQFFSNMAFRRVRWVQETFACTKYPAEYGPAQDVGGAAQYTSPWPFESVAGPTSGGTVDFRDTSAVICANCHSTMNHQAPLFAHFDENGAYAANIAVPTPNEGMPTAKLSDYLPAGESLAWRLGEPVQDMTGFGAAMAADPAIAECAVARVWNWAFGKGDIVAALALVPPEVIQKQITEFGADGYKLKTVIRSVFTSDDFVKF
jgi:hypothetical protein